MVRLWVAMMVALVVAVGMRGAGPGVDEPGAPATGQTGGDEGSGPARLRSGPVQEGAARPGAARFEAIDIFVDSGAVPLAAYQVEVRATAGDVRLVGVEGGGHAAFAGPPHYDPRALHEGQIKERIVIAAFSTGAGLPGGLPTGRTRVARLHVRVAGDAAVYAVRLETAGGADGRKIDARASYAPADGGGNGDGR